MYLVGKPVENCHGEMDLTLGEAFSLIDRHTHVPVGSCNI